MDPAAPDIDTLGYLLAAIVFSVTLLITRTQEATANSLRDASEASWRMRDAITKGENLSIRELSTALSLAREDKDWSRHATRWVNIGLFLAILVVFLDAERLSSWDGVHVHDTA